MGVNDVLKKSFLKAFGSGITLTTDIIISFILSMIIALLVGLFIYFAYGKFFVCREGIFSRSFALTLIGMTILTCMVTLAISTNVVVSLGMVGSLSIVRYRTAIKEPMDLLFLFWAITSGISVGVGMYLLTLCGLIFMVAFFVFASKSSTTKQNYILIVNYENIDTKKEIMEILKNMKWKLKSTLCRDKKYELTVHIMGGSIHMDIEHEISQLGGGA